MGAGLTAEKLGGTPAAAPAGTLSAQELPDGSRIGDATWGGRTPSDGAPDPEALIHRRATGLAVIPEATRPEYVKLTRLP